MFTLSDQVKVAAVDTAILQHQLACCAHVVCRGASEDEEDEEQQCFM